MEKLYNGIELPDNWPPNYDNIWPTMPEGWPPNRSEPTTRQEITPPYLSAPPEVIPVDKGRQLFVDDFLIEETDLDTTYHHPQKMACNPVLSPEMPWECGETPCACPKSGGVWYNPERKRFQMWYEAGWLKNLAYAESADGIHWERPDLGIVPGTNMILPYGDFRPLDDRNDMETYFRPDSNTVIPDWECPDPQKRYKMFLRHPGGALPGLVMTSPDGIHWSRPVLTTDVFDRSTIFYNPFRKKWVYSIRSCFDGRSRNYRECDDLEAGAKWEGKDAVKWLMPDNKDYPNQYTCFDPQLYNVDCVAYESIMLGMFQIHHGPENPECVKRGTPKITELQAMYSRDGFHWSRPDRTAFIPASYSTGTWDRGYVQSVGGLCIIRGDELWFYYIGFGGRMLRPGEKPVCDDDVYANGATGIAVLRRDGFVSRTARKAPGTLLTRKLSAAGERRLFVNCDGILKAEFCDANGKPLAASASVEIHSTCFDLTEYGLGLCRCDAPFRIRFTLQSGDLYAFWLADNPDGDSHGFPAAGNAGEYQP